MYDVISFDDGSYGILETQTNMLIHRDLKLFDAEKLVHALRKGSGFQGRTPAFMTMGEYNGKS